MVLNLLTVITLIASLIATAVPVWAQSGNAPGPNDNGIMQRLQPPVISQRPPGGYAPGVNQPPMLPYSNPPVAPLEPPAAPALPPQPVTAPTGPATDTDTVPPAVSAAPEEAKADPAVNAPKQGDNQSFWDKQAKAVKAQFNFFEKEVKKEIQGEDNSMVGTDHASVFVPPPVEEDRDYNYEEVDPLTQTIPPALTNIDLLFNSANAQITSRDMQEYIQIHTADLQRLQGAYRELVTEAQEVERNLKKNPAFAPKGELYLIQIQHKIQLNLLAQANKREHLARANQILNQGLTALNASATPRDFRLELQKVNNQYVARHQDMINAYNQQLVALANRDQYLVTQFENGTLPAAAMQELKAAQQREHEREIMRQLFNAKEVQEQLAEDYQSRKEMSDYAALLHAQGELAKAEGDVQEANYQYAQMEEVLEHLVIQQDMINEKEQQLQEIIKAQRNLYAPMSQDDIKKYIHLMRAKRDAMMKKISYLQSGQQIVLAQQDQMRVNDMNRQINVALREIKAAQTIIDYSFTVLKNKVLPTTDTFKKVVDSIRRQAHITPIGEDLSTKLRLLKVDIDSIPEYSLPPEILVVDMLKRRMPNIAAEVLEADRNNLKWEQWRNRLKPDKRLILQKLENDPVLARRNANVANMLNPKLLDRLDEQQQAKSGRFQGGSVGGEGVGNKKSAQLRHYDLPDTQAKKVLEVLSKLTASQQK